MVFSIGSTAQIIILKGEIGEEVLKLVNVRIDRTQRRSKPLEMSLSRWLIQNVHNLISIQIQEHRLCTGHNLQALQVARTLRREFISPARL